MCFFIIYFNFDKNHIIQILYRIITYNYAIIYKNYGKIIKNILYALTIIWMINMIFISEVKEVYPLQFENAYKVRLL